MVITPGIRARLEHGQTTIYMVMRAYDHMVIWSYDACAEHGESTRNSHTFRSRPNGHRYDHVIISSYDYMKIWEYAKHGGCTRNSHTLRLWPKDHIWPRDHIIIWLYDDMTSVRHMVSAPCVRTLVYRGVLHLIILIVWSKITGNASVQSLEAKTRKRNTAFFDWRCFSAYSMHCSNR